MAPLDPWWQQVRRSFFYAHVDSIEEKDDGVTVHGHLCERKNDMKKHEGKILIQVDEKDQNKIIAKNLITGETAEAHCSPADEFDFEAGARLALKRLTKKKYWTGKVICIETNDIQSRFFTIGKGYQVDNGKLIDNIGPWHDGIMAPIDSVQHLNEMQDARKKFPYNVWAKFIEYKGGAD